VNPSVRLGLGRPVSATHQDSGPDRRLDEAAQLTWMVDHPTTEAGRSFISPYDLTVMQAHGPGRAKHVSQVVVPHAGATSYPLCSSLRRVKYELGCTEEIIRAWQ